MLVCSICKVEIHRDANGWDGGNNAQPINDGRCCNSCNMTMVVPERMRMYMTREERTVRHESKAKVNT